MQKTTLRGLTPVLLASTCLTGCGGPAPTEGPRATQAGGATQDVPVPEYRVDPAWLGEPWLKLPFD